MSQETQLDTIQRMLESYIEFSTERFSVLEDRFSGLENKVERLEAKLEDVARNQRSMKLELLDKLASKDEVNAHELRIQALEQTLEKVA